jgi:hypothetical protein
MIGLRLSRALPVLILGLGVAAAAGPAPPAAASPPGAAAWWYKADQAGAPVPAPPIVPKGGLWVAEDPTGAVGAAPASPPSPVLPLPVPAPVAAVQPAGPLAYATVRAAAAPGAAITLMLKVAAGSTAQLAAIDACPVTSAGAWQATADGGPGPIDKAPAYDCTAAVPGTVAADSSTFAWSLPSTMQSADGSYDVALVPHAGGSTPSLPFEVTFLPPDATAVSGAAAPAPPPFAAPPPVAGPAAAAAPATPRSPAASAPSAPVTGVAPSPAPAAPLAQPAPAPATPRASPPLAVTPLPTVPASLLNDHRGQRLLAVSLLLILVVGWWWVGGQPDRGPRALGRSHQRAGDPVLARPGMALRGVGRFVRPHAGRPRRLIG